MTRVLFWILAIYVGFSVYMFRGYEKINDQLQAANANLIKGCITGKIEPEEKERYK